MSPVGGSRHYSGQGLGQIGMWGCPSCGEDNTGPLAQGCVHCGAGVPAAKSEAPPPPAPRVSERTPDDPTYDDHQAEQGDVADAWARAHSGVVSIAEAYRAGYLDGVRAARAVVEPPPGGTGTGGTDTLLLSTRKAWRTVIVALELFREQVLVAQPEEVATGEWLSPAGVNEVIGELQQLLANSEEPAHV